MATTFEKPVMANETGNDMIDGDHADFERLLDTVQKQDDDALADGLAEVRKHMAEHFEREQNLMRDTGFPMVMIHRNEHQRVLAWTDSVIIAHERGEIGVVRHFLKVELPEWFVQHAATMDTATANWARTGELGF